MIPLEVPAAGTEVSIDFAGKANAPRFNTVSDPAKAGWRYGYVALLENGERVYGDMNQEDSATVTFSVPEGTSRLWFVVTGAPDSYAPHAWDGEEANDEQWPYSIKVHQTDVVGYLSLDEDAEPQDVAFTYDLSFPLDTSAYTGTTISVNQSELGHALVLQPGQISGLMDDKVKFYAVEPDGTLNGNATANGYGHWFGSEGNVVAYGASATLFSEFNPSSLMFTLGQLPNQATVGTTYTLKQALVYEYETGQSVQATFTFNVTIE